MTDDGTWLFYKLTNEPKGLGELKTTQMYRDATKWNEMSHTFLSTFFVVERSYVMLVRTPVNRSIILSKE